jgi:hypothetical protein
MGKFAAVKPGSTKDFEALPATKSCRIINFDEAEVIPGFVNDTYFLIVSGEKIYANMDVKLIPLVYIVQPDYWGIEVVGCVGQIVLPAVVPYHEVIGLQGIRGKKGIEVIGANRKMKFDVPPH